MSSSFDNPGASLPESTDQARRQEVIDRFHAAARNGQRPRLTDFVDQAEAKDKADLLCELIKLDAHHRRLAGETPRLADYLPLYPQSRAIIESALSEFSEGTVPPKEGGTSQAIRSRTNVGKSPTIGAADVPSLPHQLLKSADSIPVGVGSVLGPYELLDKLGEGGMGAVYKARHQHLGKLVAVKLLSRQFTQDAESISRFRREMKAVGSISHPNIVQAFDAGEIDGTHFLAMEYIEGTDLSQRVKAKGPLSIPNACKAIRQAAVALAAAHEAGLVHRDVKPSNLLVSKSGQIKLLDLGLAKLGVAATEMTAEGQSFGTPDYMAPEQWTDARTADARTDLYALGCTLFFLLTGRAPYGDDKHRHPLNKMAGHVQEPVPSLTAALPEVPDEVDSIYQKLLAKNPLARYQAATEVIQALNTVRIDMPSHRMSVANNKHFDESVSQSSNGAAIQHESLAATANSRSMAQSIGLIGGQFKVAISAAVASAVCLALLIFYSHQPVAENAKVNANNKTVHLTDFKRGAVEVGLPNAGETVSGGWQDWPKDAPSPAIAPFAAASATQHQSAWAEYLKVPTEYTNSMGMKFRLIPPGEFLMGSTEEEIEIYANIARNDRPWQDCIRSEGPQHRVVLTEPYYLGVQEVTQAEFEDVMGTNPSFFAKTGSDLKWVAKVAGMNTASHPVENVSWDDAVEFCIQLSDREELKPVYLRGAEKFLPSAGFGYRLPSDAEWEFACRGGTETRYWTGDDDAGLTEAGWVETNSGIRTHPVGGLNANPFGLFDMHGNVWEWVQDGWSSSYHHHSRETRAIDPSNPFTSHPERIIRGGGYRREVFNSRSSSRYKLPRNFDGNDTGIRLALPVDTVRQALNQEAGGGWRGWPAKSPQPAVLPFDATQAKNHQQEWAAYLELPAEYVNAIGMKFRLIPPGEFLMGRSPDEPDDVMRSIDGMQQALYDRFLESVRPQHRVILTQPFYLGIHEVTQQQFQEVAGHNPSQFPCHVLGPGVDVSNYPADTVSWEQAIEFCVLLEARERSRQSETEIDRTFVYRLPTEAEWEFAARAGTQSRFWWGDRTAEAKHLAWIPANAGGTSHPVGRWNPNPFGLFDMYGNVWEIVKDPWQVGYYNRFESQPAINPQGAASTETYRVVRGGGYNFWPPGDAAFRIANRRDLGSGNCGFRVALQIENRRSPSR